MSLHQRIGELSGQEGWAGDEDHSCSPRQEGGGDHLFLAVDEEKTIDGDGRRRSLCGGGGGDEDVDDSCRA